MVKRFFWILLQEFEIAKFLAFFKNVNFELVQALGKYEKSHRLKGGYLKWWASVCYLRTNLDELKELVDRIKKIDFKVII